MQLVVSLEIANVAQDLQVLGEGYLVTCYAEKFLE